MDRRPSVVPEGLFYISVTQRAVWNWGECLFLPCGLGHALSHQQGQWSLRHCLMLKNEEGKNPMFHCNDKEPKKSSFEGEAVFWLTGCPCQATVYWLLCFLAQWQGRNLTAEGRESHSPPCNQEADRKGQRRDKVYPSEVQPQ